MKNTKNIFIEKEVTLKAGTCDRLIAITSLKNYLNNFNKTKTLDILNDFTIKKIGFDPQYKIKTENINSIEGLRPVLKLNFDNLVNTLVDESYQDKETVLNWISYLTKYPKISFYIHNKFKNLFKIEDKNFTYKIEEDYAKIEENKFPNILLVESIEISTAKGSLKKLKKLAETLGLDVSEFEIFFANLKKFLEDFILKVQITNHYRISISNPASKIGELIWDIIFEKFLSIERSLLLNVDGWKYVLFFDFKNNTLCPYNPNNEKSIKIVLKNNKKTSSKMDVFDKLSIEFTNTLWNNSSEKFENILINLLKNAIKEKTEELLVNKFGYRDIEYNGIPLSILTDQEIKDIFSCEEDEYDLSYIQRILFITKDQKQIDRLLILMREFITENKSVL